MKWGNVRIGIHQNSQSHRMVRVGRDLKDLNLPERMCWQGCAAAWQTAMAVSWKRHQMLEMLSWPQQGGVGSPGCPGMPGTTQPLRSGDSWTHTWELGGGDSAAAPGLRGVLGLLVLYLFCVLPHPNCQDPCASPSFIFLSGTKRICILQCCQNL